METTTTKKLKKVISFYGKRKQKKCGCPTRTVHTLPRFSPADICDRKYYYASFNNADEPWNDDVKRIHTSKNSIYHRYRQS